MATITISLPETLKSFVESQMEAKGYGNVSEYFRSLLREAQEKENEARLEALLLEGLWRQDRTLAGDFLFFGAQLLFFLGDLGLEVETILLKLLTRGLEGCGITIHTLTVDHSDHGRRHLAASLSHGDARQHNRRQRHQGNYEFGH